MDSYVNARNLSMVILFLLFHFLSTSGYTTSPPTWQVDLCRNLYALKAGDFLHHEIKDLHTLASLYSDSEVAIQAILEIFVEDSQGTEVFWWRSENRTARCFLLALKLRYNDEYWLSDIKSYIERFNEQEQQERSEELAFVLEYRSALAEIIAEILQKRDIAKYNSKFKAFGGVAKMKLGKRLPDWCQDVKE